MDIEGKGMEKRGIPAEAKGSTRPENIQHQSHTVQNRADKPKADARDLAVEPPNHAKRHSLEQIEQTGDKGKSRNVKHERA
jgi:hypothetical protein